MNVLLIANYCAPKSGNFAASILDLGIAMRKAGHNIVYMFPENLGGYSWSHWIEKNGFTVILFNEQEATDLQVYKIKQIVDKYYINIIHSHFRYLHKLLLLNHKKIGKTVRILFHDHMDFSEVGSLQKQKLAVLKNSLLYRFCDAYVISVMEKKDKSYWLMGKNRHWYVANGLSLQRSEQEKRSRGELREELNIRENEKLALFLGWDIHRKGLDVALKGIRKYREKSPDMKIGVIGVGEGKLSKKAEEFLMEAGIDPYADWIIYMKSYEDIFALNRATDIYISASRAEAFSYGVLEAISQNNPVVVSDIEGTRWAWEYNRCVRFKNEDVDDCAAALERAINTDKSGSNYEEIVKKYGNDIWGNKIIDIYTRIVYQ